jgi:hypothetical protein
MPQIKQTIYEQYFMENQSSKQLSAVVKGMVVEIVIQNRTASVT